jgi:hypothetical protein
MLYLEVYQSGIITDDPAHELVPIRPFLKRVEVDTIAQCREFVRICDFSHSACHSQNLSFLPTRLLRIDTSEDEGSTRVRLCLTATLSQVHYEKMEYSTLSYCWGGQQEFRLNAESEDLLLSGVSASHLPRTLFDAVQVSRHLGIPFIWIDSLCIRQDDRKEMASEVASMHLVYSNSAVTISAAKATHCEEGFLSPCSFPLPESLGYKLPISTPSGDIGSIVLCPKSVGEPIDQRGWTLQEHLLARRVLRFTNWGVHWSCGSIFHAENTDTLPREIINQAESTAETSRGLKSLSGTEDRSCKTWMGIVMDYSRRISSDSLDMLPAMSAIAETWARGAKDQYLAGLWRSHLPLALLWTVRGSRTIGSYIAPSWSWATAVGEILWASEIATQIDSDLRFEECTTILTSPQAPLGAIQSGRLVVYGRIQRTNTEFDRFKQHTPQSGLLDIASASKILDHNFSDIDTLHHFENTEWYCLQLCIFEENTETGPCGLILATKDGEVFERVGMFWFDDYKPRVDFANRRSAFQNIAPRRITII